MSQNPYAANADFAPPPESRTSVLAILSLVCSLVCVVPFLGLLGTILGISALFTISRSEGRVRGQGMAVVGIVVGLLVSMIWMGAGIGAAYLNGMFNKGIAGPAATVLKAIDAGDYKTARDNLQPALATTVTDEQFSAFGAAYQAEVGKFKSMPESLGSRVASYFQVGPLMQNFNQNSKNVVPIPASFDGGMAVLLVQLPQAPPPSNQGSNPILILNVGVLTPTGKEHWLLPPTGSAPLPPPPAPAPGTEQTPPPGGG